MCRKTCRPLEELQNWRMIYSNRLEAIGRCELEVNNASSTGLDLVPQVEFGGETGGIRKEAGVCKVVATLLDDLEEIEIKVGKGDTVTTRRQNFGWYLSKTCWPMTLYVAGRV